jgi:hypothetical protein
MAKVTRDATKMEAFVGPDIHRSDKLRKNAGPHGARFHGGPMSTTAKQARALRAILAELGATPAQVRVLVEAGRAAHGGSDSPAVLATLTEFLAATDVLGKTAHHVLGHVPEANAYHPPGEEAPRPAPAPPDVEALLVKLAFLREHIVSTIDVQGAAVWQRRADDGRPLQAYAEDLARTDAALLARLREVTSAA